ncbi:MAG: hypothetical protein IIA59_00605 [Candidatus Marinimicrobia bacterium]|nr:hypothetical protein [Candidatus Neomarinimicrobiota bacterium]
MTYQPDIYTEQGGSVRVFKDGATLNFGTDKDATFKWDGTNLELLPLANDTGAFNIGNGTLDFDVKIFLGGAGAYAEFNVGDGQLNIEGIDVHFGDNDYIEFGDAAGGDVTMRWTGSVLEILPATDDTGAINIGNGTKDLDLKVFLGTANDFGAFDVGRHGFLLEGDAYVFAQAPTLMDHFLGDLLDAAWAVDIDTGGAGAIVAAAGGTVRLTTDTTDEDRIQLSHELNWAAQNVVIFETRIKVDDITNVAINVGLTDAKAEAAQAIPFNIGGGDAITSTATDAVCLVFDTDADTDTWFGIGVKAGADTALIGSGTAPVNDTYQIIRIELDASGGASYFIDGVAYGSATVNSITAATALTPTVCVQNKSGSAHNLDVDYILVTQGL